MMKEKTSAIKSAKPHQQNDGESSPLSLSKLLNPDGNWDKEQLCDVLHWIRQVIGLFCGVLWGVIPFVGAFWIVSFLVLSSGLVYAYYMYILKIDDEEYGGHGSLLQEGMFASFTLFLLAWILVYSVVHF